MSTKNIATLEELETEGYNAHQRGDSSAPAANELVMSTLAVMDPMVGDRRSMELFQAFSKGWNRGVEEELDALGF